MATTTWRAPDDLYEAVRAEAYKTRRSINEILTEAVREWAARHVDTQHQ